MSVSRFSPSLPFLSVRFLSWTSQQALAAAAVVAAVAAARTVVNASTYYDPQDLPKRYAEEVACLIVRGVSLMLASFAQSPHDWRSLEKSNERQQPCKPPHIGNKSGALERR